MKSEPDVKFAEIRAAMAHPDVVVLPIRMAPGVISRGMLYLAGEGPRWGPEIRYRGRVGDTLSLEEGKEAARLTTANLLFTTQAILGSLRRVRRVVEVLGWIRCAPNFDQQPAVLDACSEVVEQVFGEDCGRHARCALGANELPFGISVEIKMILEVSPSLRSGR